MPTAQNVADNAGNAALVGRQRIGIYAVPNRQRGVARKALIAQRAARLPQATRLHRQENGVAAGVRVHRLGPLAVVIGMADLARLGAADLARGQARFTSCRDNREQ